MLTHSGAVCVLFQVNSPAENAAVRPLRVSGARVEISGTSLRDPVLPLCMRLFLSEKDGFLYNVVNRARDGGVDWSADGVAAGERQPLFLSVEDIVGGLWVDAAASLPPSVCVFVSILTKRVFDFVFDFCCGFQDRRVERGDRSGRT
jgi:hypothetical protein